MLNYNIKNDEKTLDFHNGRIYTLNIIDVFLTIFIVY
jgi:hypothetical protein